jgi:hypothetical protein
LANLAWTTPSHLPELAGGRWNYKAFLESNLAPLAMHPCREEGSSLSLELIQFDFLQTKHALEEFESNSAAITPAEIDAIKQEDNLTDTEHASIRSSSKPCAKKIRL